MCRYALALLALGGLLTLPGTLLGCLYAPLPEREHRVHEVQVGSYRLPGKGLHGLRLALLLVGYLLTHLPVLLGLGAQVVYGLVEEDLGNLCASFLGRDTTLGNRLIGLHEGIGELIGGLVYPLLALLISHVTLLSVATLSNTMYLPRCEQR